MSFQFRDRCLYPLRIRMTRAEGIRANFWCHCRKCFRQLCAETILGERMACVRDGNGPMQPKDWERFFARDEA